MINKDNKILYGVIAILGGVIGVLIYFTFNNNETLKNTEDETRTVMVYMVGSNLETKLALGSQDFEGISKKLDFSKLKVVFIAGGAKFWSNKNIDASETSIYEYNQDGVVKVKQQELLNMGDPNVLVNFINYAYDNYKSAKYDLIIWNHGGAIFGSENDDLSGDFLSLAEMKDAMSKTKFNKDNKIESLIFRTCLNGTIELANVFKDYAKYMVASEEVTYGFKDYFGKSSTFKFLNDADLGANGYDFGLKFIDNYREIMRAKTGLTEYYSTYSIIDLSKIDELNSDINNFFKGIDLKNSFSDIAKLRANMYQYGFSSSESSYFDSVDLYNLVNGLKYLNEDAGNKLLKTLDDAVLYNWASNANSRGLSIYLPYNANSKIALYGITIFKDITELNDYFDFIKNFYTLKLNSNYSLNFSKNATLAKSENNNYDFGLELTDDQLKSYAKAEFIVFRDNKDGYYLPVYKGKSTKLDGKMITASIKGKQIKVVSTKDKNENIVASIELDEDEDKYYYSVVALLENFSSDNLSEFVYDPARVRLSRDKKTNKIEIDSVILLKDENKQGENKMVVPNNTLVDLKDYTHIVIASSSYKILDKNGNYTESWESDKVIKGFEEEVDKFEFKDETFNDGYDYYAVFKIFDLSGKYTYSKLIKMN